MGAPTGASFPDRAALWAAVDSCLKADPTGADCRHDGIPISDWDVSRVTDMWAMFLGASAFNQDLSKWNTAAVTDMESMFFGFNGASAFNGDLSSGATAAVTDMDSMFRQASAFNGNISS